MIIFFFDPTSSSTVPRSPENHCGTVLSTSCQSSRSTKWNVGWHGEIRRPPQIHWESTTAGLTHSFTYSLVHSPIFVFQLNPADRTRAHTRHQWIKRIRSISFRNADQLYKEVMNIIQKDSDTFGSQPSRALSIYIALVDNDNNQVRYVATTNDQADLVLGKTLQRGQGIS